jgi:hypothetical protein
MGGEMKRVPPKSLQFDEVGDWSELKLEILEKYASAYSAILAKKNLLAVTSDRLYPRTLDSYNATRPSRNPRLHGC